MKHEIVAENEQAGSGLEVMGVGGEGKWISGTARSSRQADGWVELSVPAGM